MKPVRYYVGTVLIGTGDAIQAAGKAVEEAGWLVRQGGVLLGAVSRPTREPVAARMEYHAT